MQNRKILLCGISCHGYGHIAQTAPVLRALWNQVPGLSLIVQSELDADLVRRWIGLPMTVIRRPTDPGVSMISALQVDIPLTRSTYAAQSSHWTELVAAEAEHLRALQPDLVLTNNSFLLSAAAARIGVPSIHCCSLNWADIFAAYAADDESSATIICEVTAAYNEAEFFIRFTPGLPMSTLKEVREVGMVCREGQVHDLAMMCGFRAGTRFVLVSMGGMPYAIPYEGWPEAEDVVYLVADPVPPRRDFVSLTATGLNHIDVLASCDAIVTKPGYGTFAEAALHGKPLLYLPRTDWPEEPYLADWLSRHVVNRQIGEPDLLQGKVVEHLRRLWREAEGLQSPGIRPENCGAAQAAGLILPYLRTGD